MENIILDKEDQYLLEEERIHFMNGMVYCLNDSGEDVPLKRFLAKPKSFEIVFQKNDLHDFRKENLVVTRRSIRNFHKKRKDSGTYKGVSKVGENKYIARLIINGRLFKKEVSTEILAAYVYNFMLQVAFPNEKNLYLNPIDDSVEEIQSLRKKLQSNQNFIKALKEEGQKAYLIPVNKTGELGIDYNGISSKKYRVRVRVLTPKERYKMLGRFENLTAAVEARNKYLLDNYDNVSYRFQQIADSLMMNNNQKQQEPSAA